MFCEQCGNKLNDNDRFCVKCGAPVAGGTENTVPVTPQQGAAENPAPVTPQQEAAENPAPVMPQQEAAENPAPVTPQQGAAVNPAQGAYPQQTGSNSPYGAQTAVPKPPKKPMSRKAKMAILFTAIGVAVVAAALIVLFTAVLPMLNRVDVGNYVKFDFNDALYEGHASATVTIDTERVYEDYFSKGASSDDYDYEDWDYNDWSSWLEDAGESISGSYGLYEMLDYCTVTAQIKGAEQEETEDDYYYTSYFAYVENLKSDDTVVVTITWNKDEDSVREMDKLEKTCGIKFDRSDKTLEFSVADELKKDDISLTEVQEVDLLGYIKEKGLARTVGIADGDLEFTIDGFEYTAGDYTFKMEDDDLSVNVYDQAGTIIGYFYLMTDYNYYGYSDGDKVEVTLSADRIDDTPIFFTETVAEFEIKANTALTAESAKTQLEKIKAAVDEELLDDLYISYDKVSAEDVYFLAKNSSYADCENQIIVILNCEDYGRKFYTSVIFENTYMDGDELCYSYCHDYGYGSDTKEKFVKSNYYLTDEDYAVTKIS